MIKYWGTHYVTSGLFGGESTMMSFTNNSYMKDLSTHEQGTEISAFIAFADHSFGIGGGLNISDLKKRVKELMLNNSQAENFQVGGDPRLLNDTTEWIASLPQFPAMYNATGSAPLSELLAATDATKAQYLNKVLVAYANQPFGKNFLPSDTE